LNRRRAKVMADRAVGHLATVLGRCAAYAAFGHSRTSYYPRNRKTLPPLRPRHRRNPQPRALGGSERAQVVCVLHEDRFVNQASVSIYVDLLDDPATCRPCQR